jgi:hypothetical protein
MNNTFIKEQLELLKFDYELEDDIVNETYGDIVSDLDEIKFRNLPFYYEIFDTLSDIQKLNIIEFYLEETQIKKLKVDCLELIELIEESSNNLRKDLKDKIHDFILSAFAVVGLVHIASYIIPYIIRLGKEFSVWFMKVIYQNITLQQSGSDAPRLTTILLVFSILVVFLLLFRSRLKVTVVPIVKGIYEALLSIFTMKGFRSSMESPVFKMKNAIIYKNHNNCKERCGIGSISGARSVRMADALFRDKSKDPELQNSIDKYKEVEKAGSIFRGFQDNSTDLNEPLSDRIRGEVECLVDCFMDYITSIYAELASTYIKCLENSGNRRNKQLDEYSFTFILNQPVDENCSSLYNEIVETYASFNNALSIVFRNNAADVKKWTGILDEKLAKAVGRGVPEAKPGSTATIQLTQDRAGFTPYRNKKDGFKF